MTGAQASEEGVRGARMLQAQAWYSWCTDHSVVDDTAIGRASQHCAMRCDAWLAFKLPPNCMPDFVKTSEGRFVQQSTLCVLASVCSSL